MTHTTSRLAGHSVAPPLSGLVACRPALRSDAHAQPVWRFAVPSRFGFVSPASARHARGECKPDRQEHGGPLLNALPCLLESSLVHVCLLEPLCWQPASQSLSLSASPPLASICFPCKSWFQVPPALSGAPVDAAPSVPAATPDRGPHHAALPAVGDVLAELLNFPDESDLTLQTAWASLRSGFRSRPPTPNNPPTHPPTPSNPHQPTRPTPQHPPTHPQQPPPHPKCMPTHPAPLGPTQPHSARPHWPSCEVLHGGPHGSRSGCHRPSAFRPNPEQGPRPHRELVRRKLPSALRSGGRADQSHLSRQHRRDRRTTCQRSRTKN